MRARRVSRQIGRVVAVAAMSAGAALGIATVAHAAAGVADAGVAETTSGHISPDTTTWE